MMFKNIIYLLSIFFPATMMNSTLNSRITTDITSNTYLRRNLHLASCADHSRKTAH
nr:hypothetical protein Iba_chr01bCG15160 [Ipomoea batatas]GMC52133.1 hypothetical protein Iba_chr01cCG12770 [Ipomoea batatas]GMC55947.1 hypothetical protein Iba_chr01fCG2490 [Ipomoea batatas]